MQYPADPLVLDNWELENVFDEEFGHSERIGKKRREEIRLEHDAYWNTGQWTPPNYVPAVPPITTAERAAFLAFHGPRTQTYSCVLPGGIIRQCVNHIVAGSVDPVALIHLQHLIVDEYQDLNPVDQQLIHELIARGAVTLVAGDDDQSIYSFRYASPSGIQTFTQQYTASGSHALTDCFRCTPAVVTAANTLLAGFSPAGRIPKTLQSLYTASVPPVPGVVHRWRFNTAVDEVSAIAESCLALINAGLNPRDILILLSNQRALLPGLRTAFDGAGIPFEPPRQETFVDSETGRFILSIVRIVCDMHDYVAHRLVLGLRAGVGVGTCDAIAESVINGGLNFRDIFYNPLPANVFTGRRLSALNFARQTCAQISSWLKTDTLGQRSTEISNILALAFTAAEVQRWQNYIQNLPQGMNLEELRDWLWADTDEQQTSVLASIYARLNQPVPPTAVLPPRVRVMSMHGAKGLSARVVFVPGLEDDIFPGPWRQPYLGLVLEAARLLYVSITRARAACILSYARHRIVNGQFLNVTASRFTARVGSTFLPRTGGLQAGEAQQIVTQIALL